MRYSVSAVAFCALAGLIILVITPVSAENYSYVMQWGTPGTGNGQFNQPIGIDVDKSGNVYVVDRENHRVQNFNSNGEYIRELQWEGSPCYFGCGNDIAIDNSGNIYMTTGGVNKISSDWSYEGLVPISMGLYADWPVGIDIDRNGYRYVSDYGPSDGGRNNINMYRPDWTFIRRWGILRFGPADGQFYGLSDIAVDNLRYVYAADCGNNRIQKFTSTGIFVTKWGSGGSGDGQFNCPYSITVDSNNFVYVTDLNNNRVQKFTPNGTFVTKWGSAGSGDGQFNSPRGIAVDNSGSVYVTDYYNNRVQKFSPQPQPIIAIINATMVSPNVLGIGVDVTYPEDCAGTAIRNIRFSGTINGEPVSRTIDVTRYTRPGVKWGRTAGVQNQMFDINGNLLPTTPLRINLQEEGVPRFTDNVNFTLTAIASYEGGSESDPSTREVKILLPTVLLHGYVTRASLPIPVVENLKYDIKGYPGGNTAAKSGNGGGALRTIFNGIAYDPFSKYLETRGYSSSKLWGTGRNYVTLWGPEDPDIGYSSLSYATTSNLNSDFSRIYSLVRSYSYANKFNIIGHSTGGLAARYWAAGNGDKINKIITVGTPHEGITEFYSEAFSGRYVTRLDFIRKSLMLPNSNTLNLLPWFVPRWDSVDESLITVPSDPSKSPYFTNTFSAGFNPQVKFYLVYGLWWDKDFQANNKPSPEFSTPHHIRIDWANAEQKWYKTTETSGIGYARGDGYVFAGSASAGISGPANSANFVRRGFSITNAHGVILNNANIRNNISTILMN